MSIFQSLRFSLSLSLVQIKKTKPRDILKMEFWTNVIVFFLLLIFYLHLQHEWKKSGDLEIFEMDYISNKDLEDVCKLKQPVLFQVDHWREMTTLLTFVPDEKDEVIVKDIRDYYKPDVNAVDGIFLSYKSAFGLCSTDTNRHFFSENNAEILDKCENVKKMDALLAPSLNVTSKYDYWFGSANTNTPTRYHYDTSLFLLVLPGQGIRIKMCPWQNVNQLHPIKDYEHYEFWSKVDLWKNTKIKSLEFDVKPGFMVYIPSYWFYTIQYIKIEAGEEDTPISTILCFQYTTVMNILAHLHHYTMYFLQQQNVINTKSRLLVKKEVEEKEVEEKELEKEVEKEVEEKKMDEITETIAMLQPKNNDEI